MELTFEKKIKELLSEQRKMRKELAEHLSMTPQGLDLMLKNNTISAVKLQSVAEFFSVDVTYFYDLPERLTPAVEDKPDGYLRDMLSRLEATFMREVEQKNSQIAGLQRMVDFLMQSQPQPKAQKSFNGPVAMTEDARVIKLNSKNKGLKTA